MTIQQQIEALETMPLLGSSRTEALKIVEKLAQEIDPKTNPQLSLRVLIVRFLALPTSSEALDQLSTAEAWATSEGLTDIATKLQLMWCASVARTAPEAVQEDVLRQALKVAEILPELEVENLLAKAACEPDHTDTHLRAALSKMNSPRFASQKVQAWLDLSDMLIKGADLIGAKEALDAALALSREFEDTEIQIQVLMRLALQYLERGLAPKAKGLFEDALSLSQRDQRDLHTVTNASILCAIYLENGQYDAASKTADLLLIAGARRGNWFAVIDGHITHSTVHLESADPAGAINRLVRAAVHLRELVPAAAINLLKGRLAELRFTLGAKDFDRHYRAAIEEHPSD